MNLFQSAQYQSLDGLWPSLSFIILVLAALSTIFILWRRFLSRRMLVRRVAELEALSAAGRAIVASTLDVTALCDLIADEAVKIIGHRTFQVGLFEDQIYRIMFWSIAGQQQETPQSFDLSNNRGLVGWVQETQKPLIVHDFQRQLASLPVKPRYISHTPPRSALFIPLVSGEDTVGIIAAQSSQPNRFSEEDIRRLMILANQSAAAIANARLFEQERMRAAHLELVGEIARQVNAVQDLDEIFDQVVNLTKDTFNFQPVNIFTIDPQSGDAVLQASSDLVVPLSRARLDAGKGIVGASAVNHQTIVSNRTVDDHRFINVLDLVVAEGELDTQAEIAIPLIVDSEVLGVLDVQSPQVGVFTEIEKTVLEALAAEVASAIHKARQLAWQQAQAWITTAQLQVAEAISRSEDLDEIVSSITLLTPMLVGVTRCCILLWDEELQMYQGAGSFDYDEEHDTDFSGISLEIGDWGALDAVHVGQQALTTSQIPPWFSELETDAISEPVTILLLPLIVAGRAQEQGVMLVDQFEAPLRDQDTIQTWQRRQELLENIVQQAAQAIESARLRLAQQEEAWVNTALLQVAEAVNRLIDLNEILDTIVRLVPMLVGVQSVIILIRDDERQMFVPGPSFGIGIMGRGLLETLEINDNEFRAISFLKSNSAFPSDMVYSKHLPGWLETVMKTSNAHIYPLNAQGRLVGAMMVGMPANNKHPLTTRRLNILNGIAHQAATAVVNHQLYKESAERDRMQQELNVAREIQASFLPDGNPQIPGCDVASLWLAARQVSGDFYDFLPRSDGTWGIVIADVADKGVPAALFMALSRTIIRTVGFNRKDPGEVLTRVNRIINFDAESDLFVTVFYAVWDPKSSVLSFANGGHNPPILLNRKGEPKLLKAPGIALGILPEINIGTRSTQLKQGDTLILYTDGVSEAMNEDYDEFGMERLYLTAKNARNLDAGSIVQAISESIHDHAGGTPQFDDVTLVVLKIK